MSIDPTKVRRAVLLWAIVFPTITLLLFMLEPVIGTWPLPGRTMVLTLLMVPLLQFILMPWAMARFGAWVTGTRRIARRRHVHP